MFEEGYPRCTLWLSSNSRRKSVGFGMSQNLDGPRLFISYIVKGLSIEPEIISSQ